MNGSGVLLAIVLVITSSVAAFSHALEPAFLDIRQSGSSTWQVFWRTPDVGGRPMAIDVALPESCNPGIGPEPRFDGTAWITGWAMTCAQSFANQEVGISGLAQQRTDVLVRLQSLDASPATFRLTPDQTSRIIPEDPSGWDIFRSYAALGFEHILEGLDHLLFVFALLLLIRDFWRLVGAITAFTVAHSITLGLAALGHITVPGPPVETIIALSIVFLAIETLKSSPGEERLSERFPWVIAFSFGLLHGLGFAGALREIGLPQQDIATALLAFNLGVEAGQLTFVFAVVSLAVLTRWAMPRFASLWQSPHAAGNIVVSYGIGGIATFWLVERLVAF